MDVLRRFKTPYNTIKRSLQSVLNRPFSMYGKSLERHVMLRYRSILVTRGWRDEDEDGTATVRSQKRDKNADNAVIVYFNFPNYFFF